MIGTRRIIVGERHGHGLGTGDGGGRREVRRRLDGTEQPAGLRHAGQGGHAGEAVRALCLHLQGQPARAHGARRARRLRDPLPHGADLRDARHHDAEGDADQRQRRRACRSGGGQHVPGEVAGAGQRQRLPHHRREGREGGDERQLRVHGPRQPGHRSSRRSRRATTSCATRPARPTRRWPGRRSASRPRRRSRAS